MDQIGVVGLSYRHAGAREIAEFALARDQIGARLPALRAALQVEELAYLATCNRVEVIFAALDGVAAEDRRAEVFRALTGRDPVSGEARTTLRTWTGEAAVEHLFLLACGLESAQAGEKEIAAQLRGAWEAARTAGVCGPLLDHVLGEALAMSNRVQQLAAGARAPSLADLGMERMRQHLGARRDPVALVGVSPMTRRCGELLHRAGVPLVVINRTLDTAIELAEALGSSARAASLESFHEKPMPIAGLILAAGGGAPLFDDVALGRIARNALPPLLAVDFGLPANVDASAARRAGLQYIGMDEITEAARERRIAQLMRLAPVRAAIDDRLAHLRSQLAARTIGRQLAELRSSFEQIAGAEVQRLIAEDLPGLDAQQKERLHRFATTIAHRLAHLPLAGMRAAATHASAEAMEAFFREARLQRQPGGSKRS